LRVDDNVIVFNEASGEWLCTIKTIKKNTVIVEKSRILRKFQGTKRVWLAFCPVKPDNNRVIVEKCTELGVTDFIPIMSEYTNHRINHTKLKLIARSAAEQCERLDIPTIWPSIDFDEFIRKLSEDITWISAIERNNTTSVIDIYTQRDYGFIVGPEGGFSEKEKNELMRRTTSCTLSPNILRSETAAIACIAVFNALSSNSIKFGSV
jgi:16S rRNA (uracil1498-N3)-methyltransferase